MSDVTLRRFLIFAAVITGLVGLRSLLGADSLLAELGLPKDQIGRLLTRTTGAAQLGLAVVTAYASRDPRSPAVVGVFLGTITYHLATLVVYGLAMTQGVIVSDAAVYFELAVQVAFIAAFAYLLARAGAGRSSVAGGAAAGSNTDGGDAPG